MGFPILHNYPLLRLLIPMIGGILIADLTNTSEYLLFTLPIAFFFLLGMLFLHFYKDSRHNWYWGVCTLVVFIIFGWANASIRSTETSFTTNTKSYLSGFVDSSPIYSDKTNTLQYDLLLDTSEALQGKVRVFQKRLPKDTTQLVYGEYILFEGQISSPKPVHNPYFFDYATYLKHKSYRGVVHLSAEDVVVDMDTEENKGLSYYIISFRLAIQQYILDSTLSEQSKGMLLALLLGSKELLDDEVKQQFSAAGVSHVLAVSGLHVALIYGVLVTLLGALFFFIRKKQRIILFVAIISLWFFAFLTGAAPSVMRASIFFSIYAVGGVMKRKVLSGNVLIATAFIMLFINPYWLFDLGFQLSFSAVLGILLFTPLLQFKLSNKFGNSILQLCIVSITAQLGTLPLLLYYFGSFPLYFLVANIVTIPLITIILYLGLLYLVIGFIAPLKLVVVYCINLLVKCLDGFLEVIVNLPSLKNGDFYLSIPAALLLTLLLVAFYFWFRKATFYRTFVLLGGLLLFLNLDLVFNSYPANNYLATVSGRPFVHHVSLNGSSVLRLDTALQSQRIADVYARFWNVNGIDAPIVGDFIPDNLFYQDGVLILSTGDKLIMPSAALVANLPNLSKLTGRLNLFVNSYNYKYALLCVDKLPISQVLFHEYLFDEGKKCLSEKLKAKNIEIVEVKEKAYLGLLPLM